MLHYIRANAQSWGVKAAFGVIILVFVFWGVGSLRETGSSSVIATVNGKPILAMELGQALRSAQENIRRSNPEVTSEQLQQMQLGRQVLQQMIIESLLQQEAERLDVAVSPVQLRQAVEQIPLFQNAKGKFDPEVYKRVMAAQRQSLGRFEEGLRKNLLQENLRRDVTAAAFVSEGEARSFFNYVQERRDVEYVFFPAADFKPAQPGEDELKAWYESNRAAFAIPAKVDVEYILVRPLDLVKPDAVAADAVKAWYDKNQDKFGTPERAHVRHILLRLDPEAPEADVKKAQATLQDLAEKVRKGADFEELAKQNSQDEGTAPRGGDLDWIQPGETVPAFNDAAFALKPGQVSDPVRTDFGLHLIKMDAREPAQVKPLAEVEGEIRNTLAQLQGVEKIREIMDNLIEANILNKPLKDAAAPLGLSVAQSGSLSAAELQKLLGLKDKELQIVMATPAGAPVDVPLEADNNGFVVARITAATPAGTKDFAAVRDDIIKTLTARKAQADALQAAADARKAMTGETLPAALVSKVKVAANAQRTDALPVLGDHPEMAAAIFGAEPGHWLPTAYAVELDGKAGAVLVRVKDVKLPEDAQWTPMADFFRSTLENQRKNQMFQAFVNILLNKARVDITNPDLLQQLEQM